MYDPFGDVLRAGYTLGVAPDLAADAWLVRDEQAIVLSADLTDTEMRSMCAHMHAHILLDHRACPGDAARRESAAERLAARLLIPVTELAALLPVTETAVEMAQQLGVTVATLAQRAGNLAIEELRYLLPVHKRFAWPPGVFARPLRCAMVETLALAPACQPAA
ncbi:ImmA/IrrE family metallo-endopeptidase [Nocardia carnea]|uniref:ImmA/IrrE family metallo-endopeptidase n=1 Tax=Nocardia carnea TaxID=37328 RepID=UPI002455C964|nr:ImmA/IrrE family metallo-endopeptidase [Nocardia carnea]